MSHKKSIYKFGSLGKMKTLRYSQNIVQSSDKKTSISVKMMTSQACVYI